MDIKHLRYFVGMAEAGSLMKASERLHVAQPALSVHLSNLEIELGMKLMERSNRGIELTTEGEVLYERATKLLDYHSQEILSLKRTMAKPAGQVSIGMPSTMPGLFAPYLHRAMKEQLPDVSLYLIDASTAALFEWLQNGKIDFAILFNLPEDVGLTLSPLFIEEYSLVGQFSDDTADGDVPFEQLFDYPLAVPTRVTSWRKILEEEADRRGKSLSITFETESYTALRALAVAGECYTILPRSSILQDLEEGKLQARTIVDPHLRGLLSIAQISGAELNLAQKAARKVMIETFKQVSDALGLSTSGSAARQYTPGTLFSRQSKVANLRTPGTAQTAVYPPSTVSDEPVT